MKLAKPIRISVAIVLSATILFMGSTDSFAQKKDKKNKKNATTQVAPNAPGAQSGPQGAQGQAKKKGPESIEKFIKKDAKKMEGLTTVYNQDEKWYININDSLIGRDIEIVTRISKSAEGGRNGFSGYAGDQIGEAMVRFAKGPGNKIFLEQVLLRERAKGRMAQNVKNSNTNALIAAFDIAAQSADKSDNIIDVTNFLLTDSPILYFSRMHKRAFGIQNFVKERSYVSGIKTYPINTEMKTVITYGKENGSSATYEFNTSMVLLPKEPMKARVFDSRVGYFTVNYTDFDKNPQGVERVRLVARWRLEPKPEDLQKYINGELVEPAKPIVIYIDPSTPKEWVPYLIMGVNDWQEAFEQAGFKNAIYAKVAPTPEEDPTWSLDDATHSAIVYKPSDIANASGPHVSDPRSGEIIETHINWYHNVMNLLRNWYFVQCSPSDPKARQMQFDTELMGQLIRFVSSHEVGHTLGLRHNFVGSNCPIYTVANLKNIEFLKKYGHATSIMDYARFNYLAEPNDNMPRELLYPNIGPYDKWAIEWGYRYYPQFKDENEEAEYLKKIVTAKIKDPIYRFGTESDPSDPRFQSEDLGVNQMESNEVGMRNLKYIMNNIENWTSTPNESYTNLAAMYEQIVNQYQRYVNHVAKWVGGIYTDAKLEADGGDVRTFVEKAKQKEAMAFLKKHFFTAPKWLLKESLFRKISRRQDNIMSNIYKNTLGNLVSNRVMNNLYQGEILNGSASSYTLDEYFSDLNSIIFAPTAANSQDAAYQRMLQKIYVQTLCDMYTGSSAQSATARFMIISTPSEKDNTDVGSMVYGQLEMLQNKFKTASATGSAIQKAHNKFLYERVRRALTDQRQPKPATTAAAAAPRLEGFGESCLLFD